MGDWWLVRLAGAGEGVEGGTIQRIRELQRLRLWALSHLFLPLLLLLCRCCYASWWPFEASCGQTAALMASTLELLLELKLMLELLLVLGLSELEENARTAHCSSPSCVHCLPQHCRPLAGKSRL